MKSLTESGVLKTKVEELINILITSSLLVTITVTVDESDLKQCTARFSDRGKYLIMNN